MREAAAKVPAGTWVLGRGWDQNLWPEKEFPTHDALSAAVPDHPVWLTRVDGHAALVNAAGHGDPAASAPTIAGPVRRPLPARRRQGQPRACWSTTPWTSVGDRLPGADGRRTASAQLRRRRPPLRWSCGLTTVTDMGVGAGATSRPTRTLRKAGELPLRAALFLTDDEQPCSPAGSSAGRRSTPRPG